MITYYAPSFKNLSTAALLILAALVALCAVSCAPTITTTVTSPDGTITRTETKGGIDKESFAIGAHAATSIAALRVTAEK